jgi:hypothetical protein
MGKRKNVQKLCEVTSDMKPGEVFELLEAMLSRARGGDGGDGGDGGEDEDGGAPPGAGASPSRAGARQKDHDAGLLLVVAGSLDAAQYGMKVLVGEGPSVATPTRSAAPPPLLPHAPRLRC